MNVPKNVHALPGADLPAHQVLQFAIDADLEGVVVLGWRKEPDEHGERFYAASSYAHSSDAIYAIQHGNLMILELSR